jgi:anti-anti-sigma factor
MSTAALISSEHLPAGDHFAVGVEEEAEGVVLRVHGELDLATAPVLGRCLEAAQSGGDPHIVLDLGDLAFTDSIGARLLIEAHRQAGLRRRRFSLRAVPRQAQRLFQLMGVTGRIPVED